MAENYKRKSYKDYILMAAVIVIFLCMVGAVYFCAIDNAWLVGFEIETVSTHGKITANKSTAKKGETVFIQCQAYDGYLFKHFLVNGTIVEGDFFVMPNKKAVVEAEYDLIEYDINYVVDDRILANENVTTYTVETPTFEILPPTTDVFLFDGWFRDGSLTNRVTEIKQGSFGDLTLYPKLSQYQFESGRISTKEKIKTEHFTVDISSKTYVPPHFEENLESVYLAAEEVSGLSFTNSVFNSDGHVGIEITVASNEATGNECGNTHTISFEQKIVLGKADMLLGNTYILPRCLFSILQSSQTFWSFQTALDAGYAQYSCFKLIEYLEKNNPALARTMGKSVKVLLDDVTVLPNFIYTQPVEYWIENSTGVYDNLNGVFGVGVEFMHYLDDVYGNYTKWFLEYERRNPSDATSDRIQEVAAEDTFALFKSVYGDKVFDNFYSYLQENAFFVQLENLENRKTYDLTGLDRTYLYPLFHYNGDQARIENFAYNNLVVDLTETKKYLSEYKNRNSAYFMLKLSDEVSVSLLFEDGSVQRVTSKNISVLGVKYFRLNGSGSLASMEIQY